MIGGGGSIATSNTSMVERSGGPDTTVFAVIATAATAACSPITMPTVPARSFQSICSRYMWVPTR